MHQKNMTGWALAAKEQGLEKKVRLTEDDRLLSIRRLIASGLPMYKHYFLSVDEFCRPSEKTNQLYQALEPTVVRACPLAPGLERLTIIGKTQDEAIRILSSRIKPEHSRKYQVVVNEYDEAEYCGVIISEKGRAMIEIAREPNLERICHGEITPYSAELTETFPYKFSRMKYHNVPDAKIREIIWTIVNSLSARNETESGAIPNYSLGQGYYEFCISKSDGKLRFIDYKP